MTLVFTERALADLDLALEWYENQQSGLANYFLENLETSLEKIIEHPDMYVIQTDNLHAAPMAKFPFTIFYIDEKSKIVVHAIFHNSLNPEKRPK